jgi:peptidoglycan/LPS O-acetylase OafA/YrhL
VAVAGIVLIHYTVTSKTGDVVGGWSLTAELLRIGFTRVMFPFFAGLLLSRVVKPTQLNHAFLWSSLLLAVILCMPRIGGAENLRANGLYESLSIILFFPLIVFIGASGKLTEGKGARICKVLGDISYPIYITHYPFIYIYTGWVSNHPGIKLSQAWPWALLTYVVAFAVAYAALKLYDEPVRKWLTAKTK